MRKITVIGIVLVGFVFAGSAEVELTVYNNDLALVKDQRTLEIEPGVSTLPFTGVASRIDPTSVHFKSMDDSDAVQVLEQNFEYDLVGASRLMEKYLDQNITVTLSDGMLIEGQLLSAAENRIVLQTADGGLRIVQQGDQIRDIILSKLPEGLMTRPTLVWLLYSEQGGEHLCEVTYLTKGINWKADYVALIDSTDTSLGLSGWVTIDNQSGGDYEEARLKLIAGDVNIVQPPRQEMHRMRAFMEMTADALPAAGFEEQSFFEYHLYTLGRRSTVKDRQTKQISLLSAEDVPIKKVFEYDGARNDKKVTTKIEFKNAEENHLGMPLPKGKIRAYKADDDGSLQFIGEDNIDHTPRNEEVRIVLGDAFDIVGERTQTEHRRITDRVWTESYEIKLRNHKDEPVTVKVVERHYGDWRVTQSSHDPTKVEARLLEFDIPVPADEEAILTYTVRRQN